MKNNAICLEATKEHDRLKIGLYYPEDVIWRYENVTVPIKEIELRCCEMIKRLNHASRNGGDLKAYEKLKAMGRSLGDELLTKNIKKELGKSEAEYLILRLDDHVVHIPWELLCIDQEFLCLQFSMGRVVKTRQEIVKNSPRSMERPLKMWILANPKGDLATADAEGLQVFQDMARLNQEAQIILPSLDTEILPEDVKENIKAYDFVHFAGHVDYDAQNPLTSGWRLSKGNFTVADIDKMAGGSPMPSLIFSNACQSARTEEWKWKEGTEDSSFGLTNAFLRAGVKHYVGTFWEIMDEPGSLFAHEFYKILRSGKTVGEAVKGARCHLTQEYGPDICWTSYLLYGDPTIRYFRRESPEIPRSQTGAQERKQKSSPAVVRQNPLTRGTLFNYSLNTAKLKEIQPWLILFLVMMLFAFAGISAHFVNQWLSLEGKKVEDNQNVRIRQMLVAKAEKQQARTDKLFEELTKLTGDLPEAEAQAAEEMTIATVFDSQTIKTGKEKIILHIISDRIVQGQTAFKLIEQESFDIILEELVRKIRLTPPEKRTHPRLMMPKLILILETYDSGSTTLVLMRLVEKDTRQVLETLFEELENDKKLLEQKKELTHSLLEKLKKYQLSRPEAKR